MKGPHDFSDPGRAEDPFPSVSVIIVSYNGAGMLPGAIQSILGSHDVRIRCIVVDNASTDNSATVAEQLGASVHRLAENVGYGGALNVGLGFADAEWVVCANQDVSVHPDAVRDLVDAALEHDTACGNDCIVGPRLLWPEGETAETCHDVPSLFEQSLTMLFGERVGGTRNSHPDVERTRHCGWVSAVFILGRRETFASLGGFDPSYFMYVEDLDLFTRLRRQGGHCLWVPTARVVHLRSGGRVPSPVLHAHALWNWRRYYTRHSRRAGHVAGLAILAAGIVGSLMRGALWSVRSVRGDDDARELARMFVVGALLSVRCLVKGRSPLSTP
jgi:N-acetylglucosaminyl-diphospho-decaprenol L-rhamnosyltransferase